MTNYGRPNSVVISPFQLNELEDLPDYEGLQKVFIKSKVNEFIRQERGGNLIITAIVDKSPAAAQHDLHVGDRSSVSPHY